MLSTAMTDRMYNAVQKTMEHPRFRGRRITRLTIPEEGLQHMVRNPHRISNVFKSQDKFRGLINYADWRGRNLAAAILPATNPVSNFCGVSIHVSAENKFEAISDDLEVRGNRADGDLPMLYAKTPPLIIPISFNTKLFKWSSLHFVAPARGNPVDNVSPQEERALGTLREMIPEVEFRRYVKYGFVVVRGHSGAEYQIFRNQAHTKVWKDGKLIEEVCIRIADQCIPRTDNVIAFMTMIRAGEGEFKKHGNIYNMRRVA